MEKMQYFSNFLDKPLNLTVYNNKRYLAWQDLKEHFSLGSACLKLQRHPISRVPKQLYSEFYKAQNDMVS